MLCGSLRLTSTTEQGNLLTGHWRWRPVYILRFSLSHSSSVCGLNWKSKPQSTPVSNCRYVSIIASYCIKLSIVGGKTQKSKITAFTFHQQLCIDNIESNARTIGYSLCADKRCEEKGEKVETNVLCTGGGLLPGVSVSVGGVATS